MSAIDWIKSPFEVPMPTHSDASPEEPLGALGSTRVEVDSRMKESDATGPVLKAGPMAAFTEAIAVMASAEMVCFVEGIGKFQQRFGELRAVLAVVHVYLPSGPGEVLFYTLAGCASFLVATIFRGWTSLWWRNSRAVLHAESDREYN